MLVGQLDHDQCILNYPIGQVGVFLIFAKYDHWLYSGCHRIAQSLEDTLVAFLHQTSAQMQSQRCNDTSDTVLIKIKRFVPEWSL